MKKLHPTAFQNLVKAARTQSAMTHRQYSAPAGKCQYKKLHFIYKKEIAMGITRMSSPRNPHLNPPRLD
jgi:hypothetical protein